MPDPGAATDGSGRAFAGFVSSQQSLHTPLLGSSLAWPSAPKPLFIEGTCKDKWGLSWQITPRDLSDAMTAGGPVAKRAFEAMMEMDKIDVAKIQAAVRG
jgi:hypothetical protein